MAKAKKTVRRTYLTKRRLASAARSGIRVAAARTMEVMGYTVVAHDGWVVKKYADGTVEKIIPLANQEEKTAASASTNTEQLRLRVFAGPNGSGKSTVINYVRQLKVNGRNVDFGYYINADEIAIQLRRGAFSFNSFRLKVTNNEFAETAFFSGLINKDFPEKEFLQSYSFRKNIIRLKKRKADERIAQIIADFLRKKLLQEKRKFSFETVFSHHSKLEIMREAVLAGYKVYLYFVSTESPEINKFRVLARKQQGGHDVDADKIVSRYYRSLEFLFEACQLAYQVFFFDNSVERQDSVMFAHFKIEKGKKKWDPLDKKMVPGWFKKYYSDKVSK